MANEETWLSISEAAEKLEVHPRTLRRYIRDGKLKVLRLSPQVVRIRAEDIAAFLSENIKVTTGTGTCYVPNPVEQGKPAPLAPAPPAPIAPAAPAQAIIGRFG